MKTLLDLNPASGAALAEILSAGPEDVARAVARARAAQPAWEALGAPERAALLARAADGFTRRAEELGLLICREMGKPLESARGEAGAYGRILEARAREVAEALVPETRDGGDTESLLERVPHGVVAAVTPWNFPVAMPMSILVPALVAGNTVVFKPSEHVPLVGALIAELLQAVLPDGVLELVQGGGDVGAALVASDIDMVGFVGSRETGQAIMRSASDGLKRLVLELGGKDPLVVMPDANLDAAADAAVTHSLRNTGQVCCSLERVYVAEQVAERFEKLVLKRAREWKHGDPAREGSRMGPLVSAGQRAKVHDQVRDAVERGARLLLGGELPTGAGNYYPATVLADVPTDARIASEETFGPVVCLMRFDGSESEGVRL
ncbi:MAG: aldehyde dehydrogenase, partial [Planctomycetes bacterium]|nr:aldehyde dehydrogenase [Planctomycetota bacterium]